MQDRRRRSYRPIVAAVLAAMLWAPGALWGQGSGGTSIPSMEQLRSRLEDIAGSEGLGQDEKDQIDRLYKEAMQLRGRIDRRDDEIARTREDIDQAPQRIEDVRGQLESWTAPTVELAEDAPLESLDRRLAQLRVQWQQAAQELTRLVEEPARRNERRRELAEQLPGLHQQLQDLREQLAAVDRTEGSAQLKLARRTVLQVRERLTEKTIEALTLEQKAYDAETMLLEARRRLAARKAEGLEKAVATLSARVDAVRRDKADRRLDEARSLLAQASPSKRVRAEKLVQLAEEWTGRDGLARLLKLHADRLADRAELLQQVDRDYRRVLQHERIAGLTRSMGELLRKQRASLPDVLDYEGRMRSVRSEMNRVQVRQLELKQQRIELDDGAAAEQADADVETDRLRELHRQYLDELTDDYNRYFTLLVDHYGTLKQLTATLREFDEFINQRVLWVRSASPVDLDTARDLVDSAAWLASPSLWRGVAVNMKRRVLEDPLPLAAGVAAVVLLMVFRRRIRHLLSSTGRGIYSQGSGRFSSTALAFLLTVVLAGTASLGLLSVAWLLTSPEEAADLTTGLSVALLGLALWFASLNVLTEIVREQGLAEAHFKVPDGVLETFRLALPAVKWAGAPLLAVTVLMESQSSEAFRNSLGRLTFMLLMLLLAGVAAWRFRAAGWNRTPPGSTEHASRWRPVLYTLTILVPLALAAASGAGYVYTAAQLTWRLVITLWIALGLLLIYGVCFRLLVIAMQRMRRIHNQKRWQAKQETAAPEQAARASEDQDEAMEPEVNLDELSAKARRFVKMVLALVFVVSAGMVWAQVLPALGILNRVELYSVLEADGRRNAVTLGEALLAVGAVVLMVVAWRNLPELVDVMVLQRVGISSSGRFAIRAIARYVVLVAGVVIALGMVGVRWGQVQWLLAAMTVGLGFGLQEIFANFVSGLILLFERPIRIGDTITVGQITGTVTRIRMRATTITDWDRKELVVPNKTFITGQLINWTLSDNVLRLVVPVGIAYGSDTGKAVELLRQVAVDHEKVLDDPKPMVIFRQFGDNSLNLELRAFIPGIDSLFRVTHELHMAIDRTFREAGITIAFPQRDVHFDAGEPLSIQLTDLRRGKGQEYRSSHDERSDEPSGGGQSMRDEKGGDRSAAKGEARTEKDIDDAAQDTEGGDEGAAEGDAK